MNIIGITGNSGSGKSEVTKMLVKKYDAELIDSDKIARYLSENNSDYLNEIIRGFGNDIVDRNKKLNRQKLAKEIYNDKNKRKLLNSITFKYITKQIEDQIKNSDKKIAIVDAPLLFESKLDKICSKTIGVISNKETKIARIIARDNISKQTAQKRIETQLSDDFLKEKCDYIINNDFDNMEELEKEINSINLI